MVDHYAPVACLLVFNATNDTINDTMLLRKTILSLAIAFTPVISVQADESSQAWVRMAGEVVNVDQNSFTLDYGRGNLIVEIKDWKWFRKEPVELRGLKVHVAGPLGGKSGEPSMRLLAIYLPSLHVCHYSLDEVGVALAQSNNIRNSNELILSGQVKAVEESEFVLDVGGRKLTVNTEKLLHNPLDNVGYQQLDVGHRVIVSTAADVDILKSGMLEAITVIGLSEGLFSP